MSWAAVFSSALADDAQQLAGGVLNQHGADAALGQDMGNFRHAGLWGHGRYVAALVVQDGCNGHGLASSQFLSLRVGRRTAARPVYL
jgi:hypothetical protein